MKQSNTIAVLGLWHLGLVTAVGLAELGYKVIGFDQDKNKISHLAQGEPSVFEPELEKYLRKNLQKKRLVFTSQWSEINKAGVIYITFDTPLDNKDQVDLSVIFSTANTLSKHIRDKVLVVVSSQVPMGTTEKLKAILEQNGKNVDTAYVPENLRLGKAWERFFHPAMMVIGTPKKETYEKICQIFKQISTNKIWTNIKTAEMVKHALNSYLANSISFANELGNLSDLAGADFYQVAQILKMDERIGPYARINPGLGFAGGTLARDLKILQNLGTKYNLKTNIIDAVLQVNENQKKWVINKLRHIFQNNLEGKKMGILGLTYTPNTSTLRRSLPLETIKQLRKNKAQVKAYDPKADLKELTGSKDFETVNSPSELAKDADVLILMTPWPDFRKIAWQKIKKVMHNPLIIDPQNFFDGAYLSKLGFKYIGLGRGKK